MGRTWYFEGLGKWLPASAPSSAIGFYTTMWDVPVDWRGHIPPCAAEPRPLSKFIRLRHKISKVARSCMISWEAQLVMCREHQILPEICWREGAEDPPLSFQGEDAWQIQASRLKPAESWLYPGRNCWWKLSAGLLFLCFNPLPQSTQPWQAVAASC